MPKGIKVSKDKEKITLDVFIVADYGVKIPQLAWDIQTAVKEHVLKITNKKSKRSEYPRSGRGSA